MKVFEIKSEHMKKDDTIVSVFQYVTHEKDDFLAVCEHAKKECDELEYDLIYVRNYLTVCEHIKVEK